MLSNFLSYICKTMNNTALRLTNNKSDEISTHSQVRKTNLQTPSQKFRIFSKHSIPARRPQFQLPFPNLVSYLPRQETAERRVLLKASLASFTVSLTASFSSGPNFLTEDIICRIDSLASFMDPLISSVTSIAPHMNKRGCEDRSLDFDLDFDLDFSRLAIRSSPCFLLRLRRRLSFLSR
mmetsp:Transcript_528/g.1078  ORF Transcript_528/g.1078 Transcript_528/m.1078 type:complete len:180 (+) Transcript_528:26-565(+)